MGHLGEGGGFGFVEALDAARKVLGGLVDAEEAAAQQVGGDAGGACSGKRIDHPFARTGGGKQDTDEQGERLLGRMFAESFSQRPMAGNGHTSRICCPPAKECMRS